MVFRFTENCDNADGKVGVGCDEEARGITVGLGNGEASPLSHARTSADGGQISRQMME